IFFGPIAFFTLQKPHKAEAAWFNDSWAYRQSIPIATHTAAETNVYITFQLDTATLISNEQLQSACQDIRVTDVGGKLLAYHVGRTNACNNAATTIDALVPSMPAGAQTYYVYYGNPSALSQDAGTLSTICGNSCTTNPTLGSAEKAPGPIAYWKFDDATGSTAKEITSNGNNLSLSSTSWKSEDMCIAGKCLYFDGSSSQATVSVPSALKPSVMTISFWMKPTHTSITARLIQNGDTSGAWVVTQTNTDKIDFGVYNGTSWNNATSNSSIVFSKWLHVEISYDSSKNVSIYLNGKLDKTTTFDSSHGLPSPTGTFAIGTEGNAGFGTTHFWGFM